MKQIIPLNRIDRNTGQIDGLPENPRIIRDAKFEKLVKSIKEDPEMLEHRGLLVYEQDGRFITIGGNMRLEACKKAGIKEVTCEVIPEGTSTDKLRAFMMKDNASFGEWDWDAITSNFDLAELEGWGIDLPEFAIDDGSEIEAEEDNYEVPEKDEVQTDIKQGDIIEFTRGPITHRLLCGDSTKAEDVAKLMNGKQADLIITDPPYNVDYQGGTGLKIQNDNMGDGQFRQFLIDAFTQMNASVKPGAAFYIWHADSEGFNFRAAAKETGWKIRQCLIWVKNSLVMGRQDYQWKHEPCLYGWKDGASHYFIDDRTNTTVYEDKIDVRKLKKEEMIKLLEEMLSEKIATTIIHEDKPSRNGEHPTMKPIRLLGRAVRNSSKPNQTILDTFLGSGSTMVAAHQMGRNCYGMELDEKYCQVIVNRMQELDPLVKITINGISYN
jgi:site-specific DNA-methyltransferase (adenine-specific)